MSGWLVLLGWSSAAKDVELLVVWLREHRLGEHGLGYRRIQDELLKLGHRTAASTVRTVLKRLRNPPSPTRDSGTSWRRFLRAQATSMQAYEFFHVDCVVTLSPRPASFEDTFVSLVHFAG